MVNQEMILTHAITYWTKLSKSEEPIHRDKIFDGAISFEGHNMYPLYKDLYHFESQQQTI